MIAAGLAALAVAAAALLAGAGGHDGLTYPAAVLRLTFAAATALLAPLFWPGCGESSALAARRVLAWSGSATALAAVAMLVTTGIVAPLELISTLLLLVTLLLVAHAVTAGIELTLRRTSPDAGSARETASRAVVVVFALAASSPLWFGPAAESLGATNPWVVDTTIAASPLTHLALATGSDLFHTPWMYEHVNLAVLQLNYPSLAWTMTGYVVLAAAAMLAFAFFTRRDPAGAAARLQRGTY